MYLKHCKLSKSKQLKLIEFFVIGATARAAAELAGVHRNSALRLLRDKIALKQEIRTEMFCGKIELD